jgi:hypothetical protein
VRLRRWAALAIVGLWALVGAARLTRLVESPQAPPGQEIASTFDFFRAQIPSTAGYLYVLPGQFGEDNGDGPRLRYELYPRVYDDIRASEDEASIRALMAREALGYVVVPDARQYASNVWLRQPRDWLRRLDLDADAYVLAVTTP